MDSSNAEANTESGVPQAPVRESQSISQKNHRNTVSNRDRKATTDQNSSSQQNDSANADSIPASPPLSPPIQHESHKIEPQRKILRPSSAQAINSSSDKLPKTAPKLAQRPSINTHFKSMLKNRFVAINPEDEAGDGDSEDWGTT